MEKKKKKKIRLSLKHPAECKQSNTRSLAEILWRRASEQADMYCKYNMWHISIPKSHTLIGCRLKLIDLADSFKAPEDN